MECVKKPQTETLFYGKLRSRDSILPEKLIGVVDYAPACGWHECNDRYAIHREQAAELKDDYLIIFTASGEGVGCVNGRQYHLTRNTAMIFPKNARHSYYVPKGGRWEFHWIHAAGPNCDALLGYILRECGGFLEINCREEMAEYIELLMSTEYRYYEYEFFAARIISKLLFALVEDMDACLNESQHSKALAIKVIDYIEQHYHEPLQLIDLSTRLKLSVEHMIRLFREETGMTPYQYLKQFRLRRACTLMEEGMSSVREVANAVGYQSVHSLPNFADIMESPPVHTGAALRRQYKYRKEKSYDKS